MPRSSRVVIPGLPHHVVQRGNRRMPVFFDDGDRQEYLRLFRKHSILHGLKVWAYCLMDNHVHFIVVPCSEVSLARAIGRTHWHYTRWINLKQEWRGFLWQGRFQSYPLELRHLYGAVRYVEMNPVAAGIVKRAEEYRWSSAKAHVRRTKDLLLSDDCFVLDEVENWSEFLR